MMIRWFRFNIIFMVALAFVLALACGCKTAEGQRKRVLSTLRLHLEVNPDPMNRSEPVPVFREHPVMVNVQKDPFLSEAFVKWAKVIDVPGGYALSIQFNRQGSWLLEQYTASNRGKHIAIISQWMTPPEKKINKGRWLAAPKINNHITDGRFDFTPDATREEAELIALGLNHVAKKAGTAD